MYYGMSPCGQRVSSGDAHSDFFSSTHQNDRQCSKRHLQKDPHRTKSRSELLQTAKAPSTSAVTATATAKEDDQTDQLGRQTADQGIGSDVGTTCASLLDSAARFIPYADGRASQGSTRPVRGLDSGGQALRDRCRPSSHRQAHGGAAKSTMAGRKRGRGAVHSDCGFLRRERSSGLQGEHAVDAANHASLTALITFIVQVRFLSFLGMGSGVQQAAFIMHTAQDTFVAHVFHCEPTAGPLCKTIEAACKLRY